MIESNYLKKNKNFAQFLSSKLNQNQFNRVVHPFIVGVNPLPAVQ